MLKLYGFPLSQPTRAVLMLLKESSTPYQFVLIDALKGENRRNPEFKSSFPGNAVVPAIDDANRAKLNTVYATIAAQLANKALQACK